MLKKLNVLVIAILLSIVLIACGSNSDPASKGNDIADSNDSPENRTLRIGLANDMTTLDIHDHLHHTTEIVHRNIFNYLFRRDLESGEIVPELAESYEMLDDTTWEIKLKGGITFHNGDTFSAADVKYTIDRVINDNSLQSFIDFRQIAETEIIDELTIQIKTQQPDPILINRLSKISASILPSQYIEENGMDHFLQNPIGTGPFKFVDWVRDSHIELEVYEDYFDGKSEEWDNIIFKVIPENSTRVSELLSGDVDIALNMPPSEWERIDLNNDTYLAQGESIRRAMIILRSTDGYPTSDPKVRKALDLAIDNQLLIDSLLHGSATPISSAVTPGIFGAAEDLYDMYNYDPDRAKVLLEEAGYSDGFEMTIHAARGAGLQGIEVVEMIAGMLEEINVKVNIDIMEPSRFVEMRTNGTNEDGFFITLGNTMYDASFGLIMYDYESFKGTSDYYNEKYDQLLKQAAVIMDQDEREQLYYEAQHILAEDIPYILLHLESVNVGVSNDIDFKTSRDEMIYPESIKRK